MRTRIDVHGSESVVISEEMVGGEHNEVHWRRFTFNGKDGDLFEVTVFDKTEIVLPSDLIDELAEKYSDHDWRIER